MQPVHTCEGTRCEISARSLTCFFPAILTGDLPIDGCVSNDRFPGSGHQLPPDSSGSHKTGADYDIIAFTSRFCFSPSFLTLSSTTGPVITMSGGVDITDQASARIGVDPRHSRQFCCRRSSLLPNPLQCSAFSSWCLHCGDARHPVRQRVCSVPRQSCAAEHAGIACIALCLLP